jgi:Na+/melibiose symporter-like transporter
MGELYILLIAVFVIIAVFVVFRRDAGGVKERATERESMAPAQRQKKKVKFAHKCSQRKFSKRDGRILEDTVCRVK